MMLCGYSTIHYFIPTLLCLIPSLYWHVMMLAIGSFLRTIFLFRNYSQKIPSKSIALLPVIAIIEAFFVFVLLRVLFTNDNGYNFSDGTSRVFKHQVLRSFVIWYFYWILIPYFIFIIDLKEIKNIKLIQLFTLTSSNFYLLSSFLYSLFFFYNLVCLYLKFM